MNKENYKESINNLKISPDFNEKTAKLMKETLRSRRNNNPMTKKLVLTFASAAIIITAGSVAMNYGNLFPSKDGANVNSANSPILTAKNETEGITVPVIELPTTEVSGVKQSMIGLFVYKGRIYIQSNTSLVTDENFMINKDDLLSLRGDYLGKTKGSITEWSKQEDYATEFASTIGASDIYTVKGYDSKNRLMVYSEYEGGFSCEIYDSFGGQILTSGADYFDVLNLQDNIISYQWESYDSWNYGKSVRVDDSINDTFNQFIEELYVSVPMGDMIDMFTENTDYDSQKFVYVKTKDNLITSLRLFKGGYVYAPEVGFFKVDQNIFDAFYNTMPVTAPTEVTEIPTDTSSEAATIEVTLNTTSYAVGTDSIALNIKNNSADEVFYGVDYSIEKLSGETWEVVPATADLMFIDLAQSLGGNSEQEFVVDLSQLNPQLDAGSYRIVKNINGEQFYTEFELTN